MRRAVECTCGHRVEADDDELLVVALRAHADAAHPDTTDEEIRALIGESAYDIS